MIPIVIFVSFFGGLFVLHLNRNATLVDLYKDSHDTIHIITANNSLHTIHNITPFFFSAKVDFLEAVSCLVIKQFYDTFSFRFHHRNE